MKDSKTATRYAKALLDLSKDGGKMDQVFSDIQNLAETIDNSTDLQELIKNPVIKSEEKKKVFTAIFSKDFSELTSNFIGLLVDNKRESLLSEVAKQFTTHYRAHKNIVTAEVTSAIKLDEEQRNKVIALLNHDGEVELIENIDASLIGGFVVKVGDKQIDASIANRFKQLRREITLN